MFIPALWAGVCASWRHSVRQQEPAHPVGNREGVPFYPAAPADRARSEGRQGQRRGMVHRNDGAESPGALWLERQETKARRRNYDDRESSQEWPESVEAPEDLIYQWRNDSSRASSGTRTIVAQRLLRMN